MKRSSATVLTCLLATACAEGVDGGNHCFVRRRCAPFCAMQAWSRLGRTKLSEREQAPGAARRIPLAIHPRREALEMTT